MEFLEKDLEEIIYNADRELLEKNGLPINGKLLRQVRVGNYGVADIVEVKRCYHEDKLLFNKVYDPYLLITIYELKKDKIGISAFLQAVGYMKGISSYLLSRRFFDYEINITLIGKRIDDSSTFVYLSDMLESYTARGYHTMLCNYTYKYDVDGIKFKMECGYKLTHEGF